MGVSVYGLQSMLRVFVCMCVCLCVMPNQVTGNNAHYVSRLSKPDALMHRIHTKFLLVPLHVWIHDIVK